jgi:mono/diheme cytochrome c family protein
MSRLPALLTPLVFLQGVAGSESPVPASVQPTDSAGAGRTIYQRACMSCHQADGRGQPGLFPPLRDADWIKSPDPARLIRITLHGMVGPVSINGIPFKSSAPFMPGHAATLTDQEIATVLTWVRKEMGGLEVPVSAAVVASIRQAEASRTALWTQAQLLAIPPTVPPATPP